MARWRESIHTSSIALYSGTRRTRETPSLTLCTGVPRSHSPFARAQEGYSALFKGVQPRVLWISIGGSVFFTSLEKSKELYGKMLGTHEGGGGAGEA